MKCAVTVSLVPEARGGPFLFWDNLTEACSTASSLGFDGIEIFAPGADFMGTDQLGKLLGDYSLSLAAMGTGAGWVKHKWTLTNPDQAIRTQAMRFIVSLMEFAARFQAPVILGSMQGRHGEGVDRQQALSWLGEAIKEFDEKAQSLKVPFLFEPINRYESNLLNTLADTVSFVAPLGTKSVRILADCFHMNIEESNLVEAIRATGSWIGHVHIADSNRRPAGHGHTDFAAIGQTLREVSYAGYVSAEALPYPDSVEAAKATMTAFNKHFAQRK